MAKPRVFISSTYYDLKHVRSSLESFIELLGYDPVLSEKDDIAYLPDVPLDESCYREARNSDIYVLIVGGRYGSPISTQRLERGRERDFYHRYESITRHEYDNAFERNIPIYILIDASVDAEYQTWQENRDNLKVKYAHVDSVNIFMFIESIREKVKNNPVKTFSRYAEIESYLKDQWAGFFRELILRASKQPQIDDVNQKVTQLMETSETLKNYLEKIVSNVSSEKNEAIDIIRKENKRLKQAKIDAEFLSNNYMRHLNKQHGLNVTELKSALSSSSSYSDFVKKVFIGDFPSCCGSSRAFQEVNEARATLDVSPFDLSELEEVRTIVAEDRKSRPRLNRLHREVKPAPSAQPASGSSKLKKAAPKRKSAKKSVH
jgi:hypothetical protein